MLLLELIQYGMCFLEVFLCYHIINIFCGDRIGKKRTNIWIVVFSFMLATVVDMNRDVFLFSGKILIFSVIFISLTGALFLWGRTWLVFFIAGFSQCSLALLDMLAVSMISVVCSHPDLGGHILLQLSVERIIALLISRMIMMIAYFVLVRSGLYELDWKRRQGVILFIMVLLEVAMAGYFQKVYFQDISLESVSYLTLSMLVILLLAILFGVYLLYINFKKDSNFVIMKNELLERNYLNLCKVYKDNEILFHDMKNHLTIIRQYAEDSKNVELVGYLDNISSPLQFTYLHKWTGNRIIDIILNQKKMEAEKSGIRFEIKAEELGESALKESDLCAIFSNLLDNSIEACERMKSGDKWICLSIRQKNQIFLISVKNSCNRQPVIEQGRLQTCKLGGGLHGLGMESIRNSVEKYNGVLKYHGNDVQFDVAITLFGDA